MKKLKPYLFFCIIFFLGCEPDSDKDDPTMQVDLTNNVLKDPCGDPVILRGVNRLLVFDSNDPYGVINFPEIKETNANCLRIAWGIKRPNLVPTTPSELEMVLTNCAKNNMIPIISLFDYTSDDDGGFSHLSEYVEYWTNPSIIKIIKKHQGYLIINIANEAGEGIEDEDNPVEMEAKTTIYINAYKKAIESIRKVGIICPLMVDALDRGKCLSGFYFKRQNQTKVVANELSSYDIRKNLIFSVHPYWPVSLGASETFISDKFQKAINAKFPFVVGELCKYGAGEDATKCEQNGIVNYEKIAQICQENKIGWMAWEWGPGNGYRKIGQVEDFEGPCKIMDMTKDSKYVTLNGWGNDIVNNSEYGLLAKSKKTRWYNFDFIACQGGKNIPN